MESERKRIILINKQENKLLSNSTVIEQYPKLKNILNQYVTLYEKDMQGNNDFDDELKNVILYVFKDIVNEAVKEWRGNGQMDLAGSKKIYCSLCGRENLYIFFIENIYSKKTLNVGSECIDKFPKLRTGLPDGMTASQYKNRRIREYERLKQIEIFNNSFPDAKNMLKKWSKEYNDLPIILSIDLHNNITSIHREANKIFEGFIDANVKKNDLVRFEDLINERKKVILKAQNFIEKNKDNEFICTKEIYDWIILNQPIKDSHSLIEEIRNNSSVLAPNIIPFIYEKNFVGQTLHRFKGMLQETNISILRLEDNNIYFQFNDKKQSLRCDLYMTKQKIMQLYGKNITTNNYKIDEKDILSKLKLVSTIKNYTIIKDEIEKALRGTEYRVELDIHSIKHGLEFTNVKKKEFASNLSTEVFFNAHKNVILLKGKNPKKYLSTIISKINNWKPLSDKKKYDIGDISKKPQSS